MLKLISPFRALFNLDSSLIAANPGEYHQFLLALEKAILDPKSTLGQQLPDGLRLSINLPHIETDAQTRYSSLDVAGSLYVSPRVFTLHFVPQQMPQLEALAAEAAREADRIAAPYSLLFKPDMASFCIHFYDNSIAIASMELPMDMGELVHGDHAWDKLDAWTTHLTHHLLRALYPKFIYPLIRAMTAFCHEMKGPRFVLDIWQYKLFLDLVGDPNDPYPDLSERFMLMWVNRTFIGSEEYPVNHWTKTAERQQGIIRLNKIRLHLNWGNNLIVVPHAAELHRLKPLWEDMMALQYFYAAMDAVSINLVKYVGITFNKQQSKMLRTLSNDMEIIVNSVTILQVRYRDTSMEVQGLSREVMQHLEREWNFTNLVSNVQMKLDLCKANLTRLSQETNNRNQGRTELVLTGLAGMSILNLMVELSSYAVQTPKDERGMVGTFPGFMDLGFVVSHNTLSWIGIFLAVAVVLFAIKNRQG